MNTKTTARVAGLLYLIVVVTGFFNLIHVPSRLEVEGDAMATVSNILASKSLFGLGIAAGVMCQVTFLVLPLVLYKLLAHVRREVAVLMVAFAVASVPISLGNLSHKLDVLAMLGGADYLKEFTPGQLRAHVMLALDSYRNGSRIAEIFWGLWLLPFGYLVFKSGFLPKVLGVLLMLGCFGYLINIIAPAVFSGYAATGIASFVSLPSGLGEIGICLWLLIVGVREARHAGPSTHPAA